MADQRRPDAYPAVDRATLAEVQRLLTAPDAATPDHSVTLGDRFVPAAPRAADSVAMSAQPGAPAPLPRRR